MKRYSMRITGILLGLLLGAAFPVMAGKNAGGALIVHTQYYSYYGTLCSNFDNVYSPGSCENANTQSDEDELDTALIWFIAAFPEGADPGVTVVYFGNDHNLPEFYHNRWGYCDNGTTGSLEVPDTGWPEFPATAGNSIAYGQPVAGDTFFPVYYFSVWGFEGAYYGTAINPTGGYAAYVDDSDPPVTDEIELFGQVRWYEPGYNQCPDSVYPGACCFDTGACQVMTANECIGAGGTYQGIDTTCIPNPCPALPGACCFWDGHCERLSGLDCLHYEADWLGLDVLCDPNPCPQPYEACCFADGTCTFVPTDECRQAGGTPQGEGTTCEMISCRPPLLGACCFGDQECVVVTQDDCDALPDVYHWFGGNSCDPNPCVHPATEETTWGKVKAGYK